MRGALVLLAVLAACTGPAPVDGPGHGGGPGDAVARTASGATVRLLFGGDVMLGRGVAAAGVPQPFEGLRAGRTRTTSS